MTAKTGQLRILFEAAAQEPLGDEERIGQAGLHQGVLCGGIPSTGAQAQGTLLLWLQEHVTDFAAVCLE